MNLIFQTIIIAYLFLVVPFLFGVLETICFRKRQSTLSELLVNGYLLMMAVFCIISVVAVKIQCTLTQLAWIWLVLTAVVSVVTCIFGFRQIKKCAADWQEFWGIGTKEKHAATKKRYQMLGILVSMLVVSVLFTRPSYEDATLEIVTTSVTTNAMYLHNPYDGLLSGTAMEGHAYSPIEMLYATGAALTGIEISYMLYYLLPICILAYFYMGIWSLGKRLFNDEEKVMQFIFIVTGIYWMTTYLEGQSLVTGIFLNSWNGLTLLSCFVMPVVFGSCVEWMKSTEICKWGWIEIAYKAAVFVLAGQLMNAKGGFYIGLMLICTTVSGVVVRIYSKSI